MLAHSDEWVEKRILWRLSRSPRAYSTSYVFCNHEYRFPAALSDCEKVDDLGIPVIAIIGIDAWTVFATNKIVSHCQGVLADVVIDEITDFYGLQENSLPKGECYLIQIIQRDGRTGVIWTSPGSSYAAVGNLLLMLKRMQKGN